MIAAWKLSWLLHRRNTDKNDPAKLTQWLAIIAFAVATAIMLVVAGGWAAFNTRSTEGLSEYAHLYPFLAATAAGMLIIPLGTLGGAAARICLGRRDARLATLRLSGATNQQITIITLVEAAAQTLIGVALGVAGYFALIPAILPITFMNEPFTYSELVLPWWGIVGITAAIFLIALSSAGASLRKVMVTPIGVAAQHQNAPLHWSRMVPLLLVAIVFTVSIKSGMGGSVVWVMLMVGGLATINLMGPLVISFIGKLALKRAHDLPQLLAARRLLAQPKAAWRSVGGVALATFIACITAIAGMIGHLEDDPVFIDINTGGLLTLAIAAIVAATSTGVLQSGAVIDQRQQYQNLHLVGASAKVLDRARLLETAIPLIGAISLALIAASVFIVPIFGITIFTSLPVLAQLVGSIVAAGIIVLLGVAASGVVAKKIAVPAS